MKRASFGPRGFLDLLTDEIVERPLGFVSIGYFFVFTVVVTILLERAIWIRRHWSDVSDRAVQKLGRLNPEVWLVPWLDDAHVFAEDRWGQDRRLIKTLPKPTTQSDWIYPSAPVDVVEYFDLSQLLLDPEDRISPEFKVPSRLRKRVQFWTDVYTKYSSQVYVIHHAKYPWIVFEVVNTQDLFNNSSPTWYNRMRADKLASQRRAEVLKRLRHLSRSLSPRSDDRLEVQMALNLSAIPGKRAKVYAEAAKDLRVQLGQRDFFEQGLTNSARYLPFMEQEFLNVGLPTELSRIPFVESSFNEKAYSKVGASGVWQIMPLTAKGTLIVNSLIDERNSPLKATRLAAHYLKRDYSVFKSWPLAVTAYNHGIGSLYHAVKKLKTLELSEIIERYQARSFGFASENFYASFLAALHAEKYREKIFLNVAPASLLDKVYYELPRSVSAQLLPKLMGLSDQEFLIYNGDIRRAFEQNAKIPKGFHIFVPRHQVDEIDVHLSGQGQPIT